jgi:hypothetical protein
MSGTRVIRPTVAELEAQRDEILARWPRLAEVKGHCCGGCAESHAADIYGWGEATDAYDRLSGIRYLLHEDER